MKIMSRQNPTYNEQQKNLQKKGQEAVNAFINYLRKNSPSTPQLLALVVVVPLAAFLLFVSVFAFMGSLVGLGLATPVFVVFSPIIVPAVLAIGLSVVGFLVSGGLGILGLSAVSWIINFVRCQVRGVGDVADAMQMGYDVAGYVGQKVKEVGQGIGEKAHETSRS